MDIDIIIGYGYIWINIMNFYYLLLTLIPDYGCKELQNFININLYNFFISS